MPTTPTYALPYHALSDPPDGAALGEDLAVAVEAELVRIDGDVADRAELAQIAVATVTITPVANTPTSGAVTWGKTLPGTIYATATAITTQPGAGVIEVSLSGVSSTGATVWVYRTTTTNTTVNVIAIGGL